MFCPETMYLNTSEHCSADIFITLIFSRSWAILALITSISCWSDWTVSGAISWAAAPPSAACRTEVRNGSGEAVRTCPPLAILPVGPPVPLLPVVILAGGVGAASCCCCCCCQCGRPRPGAARQPRSGRYSQRVSSRACAARTAATSESQKTLFKYNLNRNKQFIVVTVISL